MVQRHTQIREIENGRINIKENERIKYRTNNYLQIMIEIQKKLQELIENNSGVVYEGTFVRAVDLLHPTYISSIGTPPNSDILNLLLTTELWIEKK